MLLDLLALLFAATVLINLGCFSAIVVVAFKRSPVLGAFCLLLLPVTLSFAALNIRATPRRSKGLLISTLVILLMVGIMPQLLLKAFSFHSFDWDKVQYQASTLAARDLPDWRLVEPLASYSAAAGHKALVYAGDPDKAWVYGSAVAQDSAEMAARLAFDRCHKHAAREDIPEHCRLVALDELVSGGARPWAEMHGQATAPATEPEPDAASTETTQPIETPAYKRISVNQLPTRVQHRVRLTLKDGRQMEGLIESVDWETVKLLRDIRGAQIGVKVILKSIETVEVPHAAGAE